MSEAALRLRGMQCTSSVTPDDCGVTRTAVSLQAAVSRRQVPGARESLPRSELLDRRIIRLGMPQQGKAADQDENCGAAQGSVR